MTIKKDRNSKRLPYVICRCTGAGVHAGELVSRNGSTVTLRNARRIWYWSGAASLSELAVFGAKNASACKFAVPVRQIVLTGVHEVISTEAAGERMIRDCAEWRT